MFKNLMRGLMLQSITSVASQCVDQILQPSNALSQLDINLQLNEATSLYFNPNLAEGVSANWTGPNVLTLSGAPDNLATLLQNQGVGINEPIEFAETAFQPQFNISLSNGASPSLFEALSNGLTINYPPYNVRIISDESMLEEALGQLEISDHNTDDEFQVEIISTMPPECQASLSLTSSAPYILSQSEFFDEKQFPCRVTIKVTDKGGAEYVTQLPVELSDDPENSIPLKIILPVVIGGSCCILAVVCGVVCLIKCQDPKPKPNIIQLEDLNLEASTLPQTNNASREGQKETESVSSNQQNPMENESQDKSQTEDTSSQSGSSDSESELEEYNKSSDDLKEPESDLQTPSTKVKPQNEKHFNATQVSNAHLLSKRGLLKTKINSMKSPEELEMQDISKNEDNESQPTRFSLSLSSNKE